MYSFRTGKETSFFKRMYLLLLILMVAFSLIIGSVFYLVLTSELEKELTQEYTAELDSNAACFARISEEAQQMYMYLISEDSVTDFLDNEKENQALNYHAFRTASGIGIVNPYVYSIVLYNESIRDWVITVDDEFDVLSVRHYFSGIRGKKNRSDCICKKC